MNFMKTAQACTQTDYQNKLFKINCLEIIINMIQ